MKYSQLLGKTLKNTPKEAETISHKLLWQAGFIDEALAAGIYSILPLGWRVMTKIMNIIREEMNAINGQELYLPTLQPKNIWEESGRWDKMDPPLFKLKDRHERELGLGSTHEEVITDIVRKRVSSYKDLPLLLYQIQNKFRNEMRASGGLMRVREFLMKDMYSFHVSQEDMEKYYYQIIEAYKKIFTRCGLIVKVLEASGGTIGGKVTHEFNTLCESGEDKLLYCKNCDWAANLEVWNSANKKCPQCGGELIEGRGIENSHVFQLGTKYSDSMKAFFTDKNGEQKPMIMGCYGIGIGRLMTTIVEVSHDEKGIIWPVSVAPYQIHLITFKKDGEEIYKRLNNIGDEVLFDDREEISMGEKLGTADLIGCPIRLVVSERNGEKIEWKERNKSESELLTIDEVLTRIKEKRTI